MGLRVTIAALFLMTVAPLYAPADTIHLKNGRTILADHVRENGTHYEYEIGDDSYAIPKSSVERVDAGGSPASTSSGGSRNNLPAFTPVDSLAGTADLPQTIIKDGKVDSDALSKLEGVAISIADFASSRRIPQF
jgi:hypothetical protein